MQIGRHTFFIRRFPIRKAMRLSGDLMRDYLAPASEAVAKNGIGGDSNAVAAFAAVLARTFQNASGEKVEQLMNTLLDPECISVQVGDTGRKLTAAEFEMLNLDVAEVYELLGAVIRANFTTLFARAKSLFGQANSLMGSQPESSEPTYKMT